LNYEAIKILQPLTFRPSGIETIIHRLLYFKYHSSIIIKILSIDQRRFAAEFLKISLYEIQELLLYHFIDNGFLTGQRPVPHCG
jgi:hypothetical protein